MDDAVFQAPVSLVDADIQGRIHGHNAAIAGGVNATGMDAGYVDLREVRIDGAAVFDQASFTSNLILAQAEIDGELSIEGSTFDWNLDATAITVGSQLTLTGTTVDADLDAIAAEIQGSAEMRKGRVNGETDWSHATVGGDIIAPDCEFGSDAIFNNIDTDFGSDAIFNNIDTDGTAMVFDGSQFDGTADFATVSVPKSRVSFADVTFGGEVWFTHATIGEVADFSGSVFEGMSHLRDAVFEAELVLRNVRTTGQFFLHGSVVHGDFDCTDASFEHFQFSATVEGTADFSRAEFVEKAYFKSSTFGDRVWFTDVSFAGHADFTDTRFTGKVTLDGTEFLVDPTFTDARFAVDPDFSVAEFPFAETIDFDDRRSRMILAHPESLQHEGKTLPNEAITGEFPIPADASHLVEGGIEETKGVVVALMAFDRRPWHDAVKDSLRTARTAVARLPQSEDAVLVFGVDIHARHFGSGSITGVMLAGVYTKHDESVVFGHFDPAFIETDYLIPIPASDDAFSSGAEVATATELHKAMVRHELFRAMHFDDQVDSDPVVHGRLIPIFVAATTM